jgi:hypothetical protein
MHSLFQTLCIGLLLFSKMATGQNDADYTYKSFTITTTFTGESNSVCGKSQRVRLRKTLQNGVNYYGMKFLKPDPNSDVQVQIEFDRVGEKFDEMYRRRLSEEDSELQRRMVINKYKYAASGILVCRLCNPDSLDRRLVVPNDNAGSLRTRSVQATEPNDFEGFMSAKLTADVQLWIREMNKHEGKEGCLGSGADVVTTFVLN